MKLRDALDLSMTQEAKSIPNKDAEDGMEPFWEAKISVTTDPDEEETYGIIEVRPPGEENWTAFEDLHPDVKEAVINAAWHPVSAAHPLTLLAGEAEVEGDDEDETL